MYVAYKLGRVSSPKGRTVVRTELEAASRAAAAGWRVTARVERFVEPAVLLLLAERPTHGYELLEQLPELIGVERVDIGNLYRFLRGLEREGLVTSKWDADLPGPAKRTYTLTPAGRAALDAWAGAIDALRGSLAEFLERYAEGR